MRPLSSLVVLVKGAGEAASAVAHRLRRCRFDVCMTEMPAPLAVCRGAAFSEALFDGRKTIEGVTAERVPASPDAIRAAMSRGNIALVADPDTAVAGKLRPDVFVDASMTKRPGGVLLDLAPVVIGLGPGFTAGRDVHLVVETANGPRIGRVIEEGGAEKNTGTPVSVGGLDVERVVWSPRGGTFVSQKEIGDAVAAGEVVGRVDDRPIEAPLDGVLRGLLRSGTPVAERAKLVEVDPVNPASICFTIRDRMRSIAGGVIEAVMMRCNTLENL